MNSLLILPTECVTPQGFVLRGERARYAFDTHQLRAGAVCRIGVLGGMRGEGRVVSASRDEVVLEGELALAALSPQPVHLVVAVPRPQTVKKVVQAGVMVGVTSIDFVRSERGEKSYLESHSLRSPGLVEEGIKALEQVWDTRLPELRVHRSFSGFLRERLPLIGAGESPTRLLAHPAGAALDCADAAWCCTPVVVAIGPELGWSEQEVDRFSEAGFRMVGLGARVVRVEVAVVMLLGQLALLTAQPA